MECLQNLPGQGCHHHMWREGNCQLGLNMCIFLLACCLFCLVNQQECLVLPLCCKSTPAMGYAGGGGYLHVGSLLIAQQRPYVQEIGSHVQDLLGLGLFCERQALNYCRLRPHGGTE